MSIFNINLHEAVYSLSNALDLVGVTHIHHGKRVAYIAAECGKQFGWTEQCLDDLFQAAILHDCGISKTAVHARLAQFEWELDREHCQIGAALLSNCSLLAHLSDVILHHHTHWSVLKDADIDMQMKLIANCIYLAECIDVLSLACLVDQSNLLLSRQSIIDKIVENCDDRFCPELVAVFMEISNSSLFWLVLESGDTSGYTSTWQAHTPNRSIEFVELKSLVHIFSHIVDAKSPFTKEHSDGVANLAKFLGSLLELSEETCEMLELAGLLHDIGKLRVPDELLEKEGKLTEEEYIIVQRHSFDTYDILKNINGLEKITEWAAQHHERLDGKGYHLQISNGALSLEARIVAVADVFQALAQNRPYRKALDVHAIMDILKQQAEDGQLDATIVLCVENNLHACLRAAYCQ
ncbi:MAG: HD domain-containing protein [Methylococcales bacterium]|nr:HD domain-containing protein [Methylococcales bacterium]